MKPLIMFVMLVSLFSSTAIADHISVFADPVGVQCTLSNPVPPPGTNAFYIIHQFNNGSTASQFRVNDTTGLFPASQITPYLALGTWDTDLSLAYGDCIVGPHVLMTLNFFWFGVPPVGCNNTLEIVAAPTSPLPGQIALVDCSQPFGLIEPASGGRAFFALSQECGPECIKLATEETTWGRVKALYQ
jgi:hypothetical protein